MALEQTADDEVGYPRCHNRQEERLCPHERVSTRCHLSKSILPAANNPAHRSVVAGGTAYATETVSLMLSGASNTTLTVNWSAAELPGATSDQRLSNTRSSFLIYDALASCFSFCQLPAGISPFYRQVAHEARVFGRVDRVRICPRNQQKCLRAALELRLSA
ncbi:MAG: hypothetical protein RL215_2157 [Planctomycetota bacterium]